MKEKHKSWDRNTWLIVAALVITKLVIHLVSSTNYGLHRDAYLYLAQAQHLDWGYFSIPPLTPFLAFIITGIFGDSVFVVRLMPAVAGAASVYLVALMVKELGGGKVALVMAGIAFILSPAHLRVNALFQPVSFNVFFWILSTWLFLRLARTQNTKLWLVICISWGFAVLTKYSIGLIIIGLMAGLAISRHRKLLISKYLLIGGLFGFLITLPNLFWQVNHGLPVISHLGELQETQLVNVAIVDILIAQLIYNIPSLIIWVCGLVLLLSGKHFKDFRFIGYAYFIILGVMLVTRGKPYYMLAIYPVLMVAGAIVFEKWYQRWSKVPYYAVLVLMLASAVPAMPYSLPILGHKQMADYAQKTKKFGLEGLLKWEDGKVHQLPQDYADMIGWEELAKLVESAWLSLDPDERENCVIFGDNYGHAGAVLYHSKHPDLPHPVSFADSFLWWAPDHFEGDVLIYISDEPTGVQEYFRDIRLYGKVGNPWFRESGQPVYICREPVPGFDEFYSSIIEELKARYLR